MDNSHKTCRAAALRKIYRISYLVDELRCMKGDECPSVSSVQMRSLNKLVRDCDNLRRKIQKRTK